MNFFKRRISEANVQPTRALAFSTARTKSTRRKALLTGLLMAAACLGMALSSEVLAKGNPHQAWYATWSMSPQGPQTFEGGSNTGLNNQTVRQIARVSVGGQAVRVRLSNAYGTSPLKIGAAHIALQSSGASIVPNSDRVLTFSGQRSFTIPPGAVVASDPVPLDVPALSSLAVSVYVPTATGPATWHLTALQTSYISGPGDHTAAQSLPVATTEQSVYWLSGVEVTARERTRVVVAVGDSITDGYGGTPDTHQRWPDYFSRSANSGRRYGQLAILNQGISGNRLLHDVMGTNLSARFDRDVLGQTGVSDVIVLIGINDIGFPGSIGDATESVTVQDLFFGLRQLAERAHARDVRLFVGTLLPFEGTSFEGYYSAEGEAKRQSLNQLIRSSTQFDGVIDFDAALRDPNQPTRLLPAYDSGDHLHPNDAGYEAMANAVDARLFRR